ncbi:MAG: hypothetical protein BWY63_00648 [Chloroflexi bacterium ADurb.Bin360]|nr:MAG: hypothetical protein BWY63_00648 [Chloroflexi bacterium ADurb.Bin360]
MCILVKRDAPGVAIYSDGLSIADALCSDAGSGDSGQAVFTGDDAAMRKCAAQVGDNASSEREKRCPCRRGDVCHQNVPGLEVCGLKGCGKDPRNTGDFPGAYA